MSEHKNMIQKYFYRITFLLQAKNAHNLVCIYSNLLSDENFRAESMKESKVILAGTYVAKHLVFTRARAIL